MSSLGEHLREATSASDLQPKQKVVEAVAQHLEWALALSSRPETTLTSRIDGDSLEIVVADPTAADEIRVTGQFDPKFKKHQFALKIGDRPVGVLKASWVNFEMGSGLDTEVYAKSGGFFDTPLSDSELRTLVADALGAPEAAKHQVEHVSRPHLEKLERAASLERAAPELSDVGAAPPDQERSPGPQPDSSLHV